MNGFNADEKKENSGFYPEYNPFYLTEEAKKYYYNFYNNTYYNNQNDSLQNKEKNKKHLTRKQQRKKFNLDVPQLIAKHVFRYLRNEDLEEKIGNLLDDCEDDSNELVQKNHNRENKRTRSYFKGKIAYAEKDFGFVKFEGTYYVYMEVPAFAIKSQYDGNYYLFEKMNIGICVRKMDGELTLDYSFTVIDNNNHPFLHRNKSNFSGICMGHNNFPRDGKDIGDVIAKRLRKAKHALMYGYLRDDKHTGGPCDELRKKCLMCRRSHFKEHLREFSYLKEMEVPIVSMEVFAKYKSEDNNDWKKKGDANG